MIRPVDEFFLNKEEPIKSCLLFLRDYLLNYNNGMSESWKYGMPFYNHNGKRICYLWVHKKYSQPYIGIVDGLLIDHPELLQEKRARMKILLIDPNQDIPVDNIDEILKKILYHYAKQNTNL
jgi:hypothetical protein